MKKIQTEQNKLLKILYKKDFLYNTNCLHHELQLLKCEDIRDLFIATFVYKQQHRLLPTIFNNYFVSLQATGQCVTRNINNLFIKRYRTTGGQKSLKFIGATIWNNIKEPLKITRTLGLFKRQYKNIMLEKYKE